MVKLAELLPTDTADYGAESMFICGQKGRGKSRLTDKIVRALPPTFDDRGKRHDWLVVIIDSKQDWKYSRVPWGKGLYKRLPSTNLRLVPAGYYVYRPTAFPEKTDLGARRIFRSALQRKYCVIVVDEGADFGGGQAVAELGKLMRQSRSKHVIVIFGCQRPTKVDLLAISEATRLVEFQLGWADDYDRMAKNGYAEFATPPAGRYDFNFYNRLTGEFVRVRQAA
ncbi:MAG TPA: hypothetical protein VGA61_17310 [Anaerolineae bacterium]